MSEPLNGRQTASVNPGGHTPSLNRRYNKVIRRKPVSIRRRVTRIFSPLTTSLLLPVLHHKIGQLFFSPLMLLFTVRLSSRQRAIRGRIRTHRNSPIDIARPRLQHRVSSHVCAGRPNTNLDSTLQAPVERYRRDAHSQSAAALDPRATTSDYSHIIDTLYET